MTENATYESSVAEAPDFLDDVDDDVSEFIYYENLINRIEKFYLPLLIVTGVPGNILALVILIRRRLWLHHEAYVYLAAILIVNASKSAVLYGEACLQAIDVQLVTLSTSTDITCKIWNWLLAMNSYTELLYIPFLVNVYLRQQLTRECFAKLGDKFCTLYGTKIVVGSFFTVCALSNFWTFSVYGLESYGNGWRCARSDRYHRQSWLLSHVPSCVGFISLFIVVPLILLVIWKMKRGSEFIFNQMNGSLQDNDDVDVIASIVVCCASVSTIVRAPLILAFILHLLNFLPYLEQKTFIVFFVLRALAMAHPLPTSFVCFAVKSSFQNDLKTIVGRCCSGSSCHRTFPTESDNNGSSALQMNTVEEHSPVGLTQREDDSVPIIHQI